MKKPVRHKRSQAGFSLVELMIVVAIIGILATIAVPNFQRMQAKAKQSEAKMQLSGLHSSMKAFHAEWNTFWGDFRDIGFRPEGRMAYRIGFTAVQGGGATAPQPPFAGSTNGGAAGVCFNSSVAGCPFAAQVVAGVPAFAGSPAGNGCGGHQNPTNTEFRASARANLNTGAGQDRWTIDHNKVLCNNLNGT